jgi:hypothetical protein
MRSRTLGLFVLTLLCTGSIWGCGAGTGAAPALIAVKGRVTYNGQPVTKGRIKFQPDGYGRNAHGDLQPDGTFVLATDKEGDGVIAGHHRISLVGLDPKLAKDKKLQKYSSPSTSRLTADVSPETTEFPFDLK